MTTKSPIEWLGEVHASIELANRKWRDGDFSLGQVTDVLDEQAAAHKVSGKEEKQ